MDISGKDILPRQESRLKAGLEVAMKHKDKLLEYDKTRYVTERVRHVSRSKDFLRGKILQSSNPMSSLNQKLNSLC